MGDFDSELIAHLKEHYKEDYKKSYPDSDMANFDIMDFIHAFGSSLYALMYSRIFWPEFVIIDDMFFLKETIQDEHDRTRLKNALDACKGNKQEIEESFNFIEIPYCFSVSIPDTTDKEDDILVRRIAEMWRARLAMVFPDRSFKVDIIEPEESGSVVSLTFYQC